jgi:hypothetical protein
MHFETVSPPPDKVKLKMRVRLAKHFLVRWNTLGVFAVSIQARGNSDFYGLLQLPIRIVILTLKTCGNESFFGKRFG